MTAGLPSAERVRASTHPDIDWALSAYPAAVVHRADAAIRVILEARSGDVSPGRWCGSRLTGDGFPFELSFCTADDRLRFTAEPGMRDLPPQGRLSIALQVLQRLSTHAVLPEVVGAFSEMQRHAGTLRYGAWIGARVSRDNCVFKLYAEVPESCEDTAWRLPFALSDRAVTTRMVAYTPATGAIELYARVLSLEPRHLRGVLAPAGLEDRAGEMLDLLAAAYNYSLRNQRIPGPSVGVSYVTETGAAPRVTLYVFARSLWGADARIRRQFRQMAARHRWNDDIYERLTAPIAARESWKTYHGVVGIALQGSGTELTIGLRPVAP